MKYYDTKYDSNKFTHVLCYFTPCERFSLKGKNCSTTRITSSDDFRMERTSSAYTIVKRSIFVNCQLFYHKYATQQRQKDLRVLILLLLSYYYCCCTNLYVFAVSSSNVKSTRRALAVHYNIERAQSGGLNGHLTHTLCV